MTATSFTHHGQTGRQLHMTIKEDRAVLHTEEILIALTEGELRWLAHSAIPGALAVLKETAR